MSKRKFPEDKPGQKLPPGDKNTSKKKGSGLTAASVSRSATAQTNPRTANDVGRTGTNVSYEGASAPGAGGSLGTGDASGKEATGSTMRTNSDFEQNRGARPSKKNHDGRVTQEDIDEFDDETYPW